MASATAILRPLLGDGVLGSAPSPAGHIRQLLIADRLSPSPPQFRRMGWKVELPGGQTRYTGDDRDAAAQIAKKSGGELKKTRHAKPGNDFDGITGRRPAPSRGMREVSHFRVRESGTAEPRRSSPAGSSQVSLGAGWIPSLRKLFGKPRNPKEILRELRPWVDADEPMAKLRDTLQQYEDQYEGDTQFRSPEDLPPAVLKAARKMALRLSVEIDKYSHRAADVGSAANFVASASWSIFQTAGTMAALSTLLSGKTATVLAIAGFAIPTIPLWVPVVGMAIGILGLASAAVGSVFANWAESTARTHKRALAEIRERYLT